MNGKGKKRGQKRKNEKKPQAFNDLWKSNNLEMLTAALLLSGKLRVNSIQITRKGTLSVILFGELIQELAALMNVSESEIQQLFTSFKQD